jgi:hypothetical protein
MQDFATGLLQPLQVSHQSFELLLGQLRQIRLALDCEPLNELFLMHYDPARSGDL